MMILIFGVQLEHHLKIVLRNTVGFVCWYTYYSMMSATRRLFPLSDLDHWLKDAENFVLSNLKC